MIQMTEPPATDQILRWQQEMMDAIAKALHLPASALRADYAACHRAVVYESTIERQKGRYVGAAFDQCYVRPLLSELQMDVLGIPRSLRP